MASERHIYSLYHILAPDGRGYVGCTSKTLEERWRNHRAIAPGCRDWPGYEKASLDDAFKRFGKENFILTHLGCAVGAENAAAFETAAIAQFGTLKPNGYNRAARSNLRRDGKRGQGPRPLLPRRDIIKLRSRARYSWPPVQQAA